MVTIPVKEYTELVKKAHAFDIIREKERGNKYLDSFERAIFGFEKPEPPKGEPAGGGVDA